MDNKELEEKYSPPTKVITSTEKKRPKRPKDPGRIAAGKKLAEYNKKAREAKKENKEILNESKQETSSEAHASGSFSLTNTFSS